MKLVEIHHMQLKKSHQKRIYKNKFNTSGLFGVRSWKASKIIANIYVYHIYITWITRGRALQPSFSGNNNLMSAMVSKSVQKWLHAVYIERC